MEEPEEGPARAHGTRDGRGHFPVWIVWYEV